VPQLLSVATVATVLEDGFVRQRTIRLAHFSLLSSCRHLRNSNPSPLRRRGRHRTNVHGFANTH